MGSGSRNEPPAPTSMRCNSFCTSSGTENPKSLPCLSRSANGFRVRLIFMAAHHSSALTPSGGLRCSSLSQWRYSLVGWRLESASTAWSRSRFIMALTIVEKLGGMSGIFIYTNHLLNHTKLVDRQLLLIYIILVFN